MVNSSVFLHDLMNNLIKLFCDLINGIFAIIKAKLLYYLYVVNTFIVVDILELSDDTELFKQRLLELQTLINRYKLILVTVKGLLATLITLLYPTLGNFASGFLPLHKIVKMIFDKISYENNKISEIIKRLSSIKLEKSIELTRDKKGELVMNLKMTLENLHKPSSDIITMRIDESLVVKFNKSAESIKKLLEEADKFVSKEIMSIIRKLDVLETINLLKLYRLIKSIKFLYLRIFIRIDVIVCTIEFYQEIQPLISTLIGLMKFECCNAREFLGKCSQVEKYIGNLSKSINECIKNLAKSLNGCKLLGLRPKLVELYIYMIGRILLMKFYVDLMMMEILIFKTIILTLIEMSVSSVFIDELMLEIASIEKVDDAIPRLMAVDVYLKTFYLIQLENTLTILGFSSLLLFSESIHQQYRVLLYNLDLINRLIWVVECYIHHLLVFFYVTKGLNSLIGDISKELQIDVQIYKVMGG